MKFKIIYILLVILIPLSSEGQDNLSLSDALRIGLENNYQIRVSGKNVEIAKNNNEWGNAGRYPSLTLNLNQINRYDDRPSTSTLGDKYSTTSVTPGLNLGWNLFDGFAVNITKKNFETLQQLSEGSEALVVENSLQSIILAYYQVLLEKEKLNVVKELMNLSRDRYDYLLIKKEIGNAVTFDVLQAKNAFLSDSSAVLMQEMNLRSSETTLNLLLGVEAGKDYILSGDLNVPLNDFTLSDLMSKMKSENKTLKNQYLNQRLLENSKNLSKSNLYPNLYLNAGTDKSYARLKYQDIPQINSNSFDYYVNFSLSYNLFNGGKVKRSIKNAVIQEEIATIQTSELEHNMENALLTLFDFYNLRKQLYLLSEENLVSTKLNLSMSEEKFRSGTINSFNYRDIQIMYLNASFNRIEAIYNLIDANTELLRITGGIISEYSGGN